MPAGHLGIMLPPQKSAKKKGASAISARNAPKGSIIKGFTVDSSVVGSHEKSGPSCVSEENRRRRRPVGSGMQVEPL